MPQTIQQMIKQLSTTNKIFIKTKGNSFFPTKHTIELRTHLPQ